MREEKVTRLWEDYENGLQYQGSIGLSQKLPRFVRFYEGDQWPAPTRHTKNLPRPVVNIIKMICRSKKSAILSTPVRIVYRAEDERIDVEKFNRFAEYIQKELGQEALDKQAIEDGVKKGSYFYHYYWDADARGKDGVREGALRGEVIDPLHIFFSDPTERDEQKQKWILIQSRESVSAVRASCDADVDRNEIVPDRNEDRYGRAEQEGEGLCTVLTRYFRRDGEVFCEKATRNVIVNRAFPIAPDVSSALRELTEEEDAPSDGLPDAPRKGEGSVCRAARAPLFPIVAGSYELRENSIYGLGEVEGLIPNQKAINFNLAMSLLNAQEIAWGKYVVLPGALGNQTINNEPGQVLTDYSKTGSGIRKMTEQTMQSQPLQLVETLTQLTRVVTGSGELMTGEALGANMSGAAIAQLQAQALLPTEELKEAFWLTKEKQGKVLAQFFKLFYYQKEFRYTADLPLSDGEGVPILDETGAPRFTTAYVRDDFRSEDYRTACFEVVVETTSGTRASAAGDITVLDVLFAKGAISLRTYLEAYPKDALSNKSEILKGVERDAADALARLQKQNEALQAEAAQYADTLKKREKSLQSVTSLIRENGELRALLAQLYDEAKQKILAGNAVLRETRADASDFAAALAGMTGEGSGRESDNDRDVERQ